MASHKRAKRTDGQASSSASTRRRDAQSPPASPSQPPASNSTPLAATARRPWPRTEGKRISCNRNWEKPLKKVFDSEEYINRGISEHWDDFDSLSYNGWLGVEMKPTRIVDMNFLGRMGIQGSVVTQLRTMGLGNIAFTSYDLYPDLARQFLATVDVHYANERAKRALEGVLSFMIRGVRYRLSLRFLCRIYGFEEDFTEVALPAQFPKVQDFWGLFGTGRYDSKTSTQTDVRHPALRYVIRAIGHTLLCKMEPGKMRLTELILLYMGLRNVVSDACVDEELERPVNMGAVFAHHLVSLKTKPFTGTGKKTESIGSLLTPIFRYLRIPTAGCQTITDRPTMDEEYLLHARWMQPSLMWCFSDTRGSHMIKLPQTALTDIRDDSVSSALLFQPDPSLLHAPPATRRRRGASSRAAATPAEDLPAEDFAGPSSSTPAFELPAPPAIPMDETAFQTYVVQSFQAVWGAIATLSRCGCVRPVQRHRSRSRSPPPPADDEDS